MSASIDSFKTKKTLKIKDKNYSYYSLESLQKAGFKVNKLPFSIRILLENLLRNENNLSVFKKDIEILARSADKPMEHEINFMPSRVILQDFTGVPCVVDLATMRDAIVALGGDPKKINPLQPVELVIDHSVQVDAYGTSKALKTNIELEFERNRERYEFLKWGQNAFNNFKVVPPDTGIVHQVNLEHLGRVVMTNDKDEIFPDTVFGTDSHTTMINGLGILGWGVGGIEAEAAMLGQPSTMLIPQVVGFKLTGKTREGVTATDAVLTITQILRKKGVVGKFVEFFGSGMLDLSLADRATIANMAPEYGATCGFFPVDKETLTFLKLTGRSPKQIALVEKYLKAQGMFVTKNTKWPTYSDTLELDLSTIEPSMAGPSRPQDRVLLKDIAASFLEKKDGLRPKDFKGEASNEPIHFGKNGKINHIPRDGDVVIAAITSCTNTSNPSVMMAAGLVAKKAVKLGLTTKPWVKTSLAPGSQVVTGYLEKTKLLSYLEKLHFNVVGYGCTTCIGNSGPLHPAVSESYKKRGLVTASVLSGNRNFEGRVHSDVRANYLASPPLVVAYALAGKIDIKWDSEPLGHTPKGKPIFLKDIWPTNKEVKAALKAVTASLFTKRYKNVFDGDKNWKAIKVTQSQTYSWDDSSTYIRRATYFDSMTRTPAPLTDIKNARVLAVFGDSITTDHISPAGNIKATSPAGVYLKNNGVAENDFNSYGSRRGNHEAMVRGTFANVRIKNQMLPGTEGGVTKYIPTGETISIYDAAAKYHDAKTPLVVIAGKEYGSGSSRDWAAKGPYLQGIKAVIAQSYERIHRSNLIGMGILPLQFLPGQTRESLGLTGEEEITIEGLMTMNPRQNMKVVASGKVLEVLSRVDTPVEMEYLRHGGILQYVLRQLL